MNSTTDTRTRILDVAQDLIQRRGINGMSFQDISREVGIRKPSIHHHFGSKNELIVALLVRYRSQFDAELQNIQALGGTGSEKLRRYICLFEDTLKTGDQDKSCLCGMLAAEFLSLSDPASDAVRGFLQDNIQFLTGVVTVGQKDGSLRLRTRADDCAAMILSTLQGGLLVARATDGPDRLSIITDQLLTMLTHSGD